MAGQEVFVTASIGIAVTDDAHTQAGELLRDSDAAMYRAKRDGRARAVLFEDEQHRDARDHLELDTALNYALEREELWLAWQPIFDLESGRAVGAEALLRWRHPERGELLSGDFLHIAEEKGLIVPIGRWVLAEACREAGRWAKELGDAAPWVSVNLSVRQLEDPHVVGQITENLRANALAPERLCVEITEQALLAPETPADSALRALKGAGVQLALDDFGMGHSSLHVVKQAPIDCLKIDASFIAGLERDSQDRAICKAMVALGADLGLQVVAGGSRLRLSSRSSTRSGAGSVRAFICRRLRRPTP